jgi:ubiquinone biosynthesis protein
VVSIINAVRDIDRLREIAQVLIRHGMGELVARIGLSSVVPGGGQGAGAQTAPQTSQQSFAQRLRLVLQDLGPSFVKLGQIVSTRPDIIPADVITELKKLQDSVPPFPVDEVRAQIEETLGAPIEAIYESFDERPLASASIGQVHRARLRLPPDDDEGTAPLESAISAAAAGDEAGVAAMAAAAAQPPPRGKVVDVVVKVQRPRIRSVIERDLELLHMLARITERAIPESRIYSPTGLVEEFDRAIMAELDFNIEADHAERFARNFASHELARFPKVYRQALGKKVITLEFLDGKKIYDAVRAGCSGEYLAKKSLGIVAKMIFEDGFFHADPHPGNILILTPGGDLTRPLVGLIDLGLVGELPPELREHLVDLMLAAIRADSDSLADAMLRIGRPRGKVDMTAYRATVRRLSAKYFGKPLKEIEIASLVTDLVQGAIQHNIDIPVELSLMGKSLMTIEGIGKELYPDLDIWEEARPFLLELVMKRFHPARVGNELWRGISQLSNATRDLPLQVHEILEDLRRGDFEVRSRNPDLDRITDRLGRRMLVGLTLIGLLGSGTALLIASPRYHALALAMLVSAAVLFLGHLARDLTRGPKQS